MSRVLFALLIVSCVLGGWNYFQSTSEIEELRDRLKVRESEVANHCAEIEGLRKENGRLQNENRKFDKWVKTRSNFELNKVQLKMKFDQIIQDFREAENLLSHIDEVHKPTYGAGMHIVPSSTQNVDSRTNNVSRADMSLPEREGGRRADAATESSMLRKPRREDKEKEKSWFEAPLENVKRTLSF